MAQSFTVSFLDKILWHDSFRERLEGGIRNMAKEREMCGCLENRQVLIACFMALHIANVMPFYPIEL